MEFKLFHSTQSDVNFFGNLVSVHKNIEKFASNTDFLMSYRIEKRYDTA